MSSIDKWLCRTFILSLGFIFSHSALARSPAQLIFESTYPNSDTTDEADCQACHGTRIQTLNIYGKAICDEIIDETSLSEKLATFRDRLIAVENQDSDGNGVNNIEEINSGAQPGWSLGATTATFFRNDSCLPTGQFEAPPSWLEDEDLDPEPTDNQPPLARNDSASTALDQAVTLDVLANDFDSNGDTIEVTNVNVGVAAHGLVHNNQYSLEYVPDPGFCGDAQFSYQASDGIDTSNTASVTISVGDSVAPVVEAPLSNLVLSLPAGSGAVTPSTSVVANWLSSANANDAIDGALPVSNNAPDIFEPGTTTVVFSAIDSCGNTQTAVRDLVLSIESNNPPVVSAPSPTTLAVTAPLCAQSLSSSEPEILAWMNQATAQDIEDGSLAVTNNAQSSLPLGSTIITFSATDSLGEIGYANGQVSILETPNTSPQVQAPSDTTILIPANQTSISSANSEIQSFLSQASAMDAEDGALSVTHDTPPVLNTGATTITFTAVDDCGAVTTRQATLTIAADLTNTAPQITPPQPLTITTPLCAPFLPATNAQISAFLNGASALDNEDGDITGSITHDAPLQVPVGRNAGQVTVVNFSVTDSGYPVATPLSSTTSSRITLTDPNTPPTISAPTAITTSTPNVSIPATDAEITTFLGGAIANDLEDGALSYTNNAPSVFLPGETVVNFVATDTCGLSANATASVTIPVDLEAPIITLNGDNPFELEQNTPFSDPGATAFDNFDGDLSQNIVTTGFVDSSTIGSYLLSYNVSDSGGNDAQTVTREVTVLPPPDLVAPVISLLGSDPIEVIQNTPFIDPGAVAVDDVDGDLSSEIISTGVVDTTVTGTYTRSYNVTDNAGNAALTVVRTVFVVAPDTTPPVITLLGSANVSSEQNVFYSDAGATATDDVDGNLTQEIIVSGSVDFQTVGTYVLQYNVSDTAGNAATTVTRTVTITAPIDTIAPVITLVGSSAVSVPFGSNYSDQGATALDNVDGDITANIIESGHIDTNTPGTYTRWYNVSDAAGNAAIAVSRTVTVNPPLDVIPPVITLLGGNPISVELNNPFIDPGAIATDLVDGDVTPNISASGNVNTAAIGSYTRTYDVSDAAGNAATQVTRTVNVVAPADTVRPVISLNGSSTITLVQGATYTDQGATAFDNLDGDISSNIITTGNVNTAVTGTYIIWYNVADAAGNQAIAVSRTIVVNSPADTTPPVITLIGGNPLTVEQNTVFSDPGATAFDSVDGNISVNVVASGSVNTAIVGQYTRSYNVSDAAGNSAATVTRIINVVPPADTVAPVILVLGDNPYVLTQNQAFSDPGATATDNIDGNISSKITTSGNVNTSVIGTYSLNYNVADAAGNSANTATRTVIVNPPADTTPPTLSLNGNSALTIEQGTTFSDPGAVASDNIDGTLTPNIVVTGSVDANTEGTYTLTYNVSDSAGNAAAPVARIVNVLPSTSPVISLSGDNPVELAIGGTYVEPGFTATDNVDGDISASVTVNLSALNVGAIGSYPITYAVSDAAGNAAIVVSRIVNVVALNDTISPVITLAGSNPLELTIGDSYIEPGYSAIDNVDGNITSAVSVDASSVNTSAVGTYYVDYDVVDASGNSAKFSRVVTVINAQTNLVAPTNGGNLVSFTSEYGQGWVASDLTNGVTNEDGWSSARNPGTQEFIYTFSGGQNASLNTAIIYGGTGEGRYFSRDVQVWTSADGVNFTIAGIGSLTNTAGDTVTVNLGGDVAQAIKLVVTSGYRSDYWELAEFVVNGVFVTSTSDTTAPVINLAGNNPLNLRVGDTFNEPGFSAIDNVDGNVTSNVVIDSSALNTNVIGNYLVTYNVTDSAGNSAVTRTRTVNVTDQDTETPQLTLLGPNPIEVPVNTTFIEPGFSAVDNQDGDLTSSVLVDASNVNTGQAGSYIVYYRVSDQSGNITTASRWVNITSGPDTSAPVISLLGDNPIDVLVGTSYSEPGFLAVDNVDGDVRGSVVVDQSALNTNVVGNYTIAYNITDAAGNAASTVYRTVRVIAGDTIAPVITLFGANPVELNIGDSYSEPGFQATDNIDGTITSSVSANTASLNTSVAGTYTITYNVSDSAGNNATTVVRRVNVTGNADVTPPVISLAGPNPLELFVGDAYVEYGYSAIDNVDGEISSNVISDASAVDINSLGSYQVTYTVTDAAGNVSSNTTRTVNVVSPDSTDTSNPSLNVGAASVTTTMYVAENRTIADLNLFLDMSHDYPGDVIVYLTSPSGTRVKVIDRPGQPASTWGCSRNDFLVTLDDEASSSVEAACSSSVPAIRDSKTPNELLSLFDGESSQGTWTLQIDDAYTSSDGGVLNSWSLLITAERTTPPPPSIDFTAPVITLLGDSVIEHRNGVIFNDPGATASDNVDGDLSGSIIVSGNVDITTNGTYQLTYYVQDAAGNDATPVVRTVNVSSPSDIFIEAETGTIAGNHSVRNTHAGFTGSGFVDYSREGYMEYSFNGSNLPYALNVRYALRRGNRPLEVILNGVSQGTLNFPATGAWNAWQSTGSIMITPVSGVNTLRLQTTGSSGANVDSILLSP